METSSSSIRSFVSSNFSTTASTSNVNATPRATDDDIQLHTLLSGDQGGQEALSGPYHRKPAHTFNKPRVYLTVFLRNIQLLCLEAIGPWRKTQETPKAAIRKGRIPALLGLAVHIIPLAATLSLIVLNIRTKYAGTGNAEVPLQFLAKFLELFAQASICNVVLTYVRLELIGQQPFPFGALFSGLHVTKLSSLWSLEFLGSITSSSFTGRRRLVFCLFIPFNVLLAAGIGPSIAITLIPRQQQFPAGMTYRWMNATSESLYPMDITMENVDSHCLTPRAFDDSEISCPFTDWRSVAAIGSGLDWGIAGILQHNGALGRALHRVNLSALSDMSTTDPSNPFMDLRDGGYSALTTPSLQMSQELVLMEQWWTKAMMVVKDKTLLDASGVKFTVEAKQPISWVSCEPGRWSPSTGNAAFKLRDWSADWTISAPEFKTLSPESPNWQIAWVDQEPPFNNYSALALVLPPWTTNNSTTLKAPPEASQYGAQVCLVGAAWADSTVVLEFKGAEQATDFKGSTPSFPSWPDGLVRISRHWAELLTPTLQDFNISVLDVLMSSPGEGHVSDTLAGAIVNGMSQIGCDFGGYFDALDEIFDAEDVDKDWATGFITGGGGTNVFNANQSVMDNNYRATFRVSIDGLAYSTEGVSVKIALAVLFIYCTYIIAFIVYTLGYSGHYSGAWDSIAELTALAMLSQPTEKLQNTSAGIETAQLFKEPINIRAAGYDHLEIVFANDSGNRASDTVRENKDY